MTKVFVHGNPETDAIWGPLIDSLGERGVNDVVCLSPPGFGAPVPAGFDALPGSYVSWLANELEQIGGTIDLLGHDWGAGHVTGLAAARPDLIRSWATDCAGLLHPEYVWHDGAQAWQTPEVGEEVIAMMRDMPLADRVEAYKDLGLTADIAQQVAQGMNAEMADCILKLYRGAVQPYLSNLGEKLAAAERRPALILDAVDDPYVASDLAKDVAASTGAQVVRLEGQSHWWMMEPAVAADGLVGFWAAL